MGMWSVALIFAVAAIASSALLLAGVALTIKIGRRRHRQYVKQHSTELLSTAETNVADQQSEHVLNLPQRVHIRPLASEFTPVIRGIISPEFVHRKANEIEPEVVKGHREKKMRNKRVVAQRVLSISEERRQRGGRQLKRTIPLTEVLNSPLSAITEKSDFPRTIRHSSPPSTEIHGDVLCSEIGCDLALRSSQRTSNALSQNTPRKANCICSGSDMPHRVQALESPSPLAEIGPSAPNRSLSPLLSPGHLDTNISILGLSGFTTSTDSTNNSVLYLTRVLPIPGDNLLEKTPTQALHDFNFGLSHTQKLHSSLSIGRDRQAATNSSTRVSIAPVQSFSCTRADVQNQYTGAIELRSVSGSRDRSLIKDSGSASAKHKIPAHLQFEGRNRRSEDRSVIDFSMHRGGYVTERRDSIQLSAHGKAVRPEQTFKTKLLQRKFGFVDGKVSTRSVASRSHGPRHVIECQPMIESQHDPENKFDSSNSTSYMKQYGSNASQLVMSRPSRSRSPSSAHLSVHAQPCSRHSPMRGPKGPREPLNQSQSPLRVKLVPRHGNSMTVLKISGPSIDCVDRIEVSSSTTAASSKIPNVQKSTRNYKEKHEDQSRWMSSNHRHSAVFVPSRESSTEHDRSVVARSQHSCLRLLNDSRSVLSVSRSFDSCGEMSIWEDASVHEISPEPDVLMLTPTKNQVSCLDTAESPFETPRMKEEDYGRFEEFVRNYGKASVLTPLSNLKVCSQDFQSRENDIDAWNTPASLYDHSEFLWE